MRRIPVYALALGTSLGAGCGTFADRTDRTDPTDRAAQQSALALAQAARAAQAAQAAQAPTVAASAGEVRLTPASAPARSDSFVAPVVRGLYVNRFAAQSARKMRWLIDVADSTEINGLVIDMKDEFGLNYRSENPAFRRNAGNHGVVADVKALMDTIHAHKIIAIARVVVFKDPVAAELNPAWTIRRPDSSMWQDKKHIKWVDPYNRALWEYNLGVAEELVRLGFDEIQFDYIRFPEPYRSLGPQVFPAHDGHSKPELLALFLKTARERLHKLGVRSTADVFGFVTTVRGPLEVGQWWEKLAPVTDVILPMSYPSHYPRGTWGIARPNAEPYQIQKISIDTARARDRKLGITAPEHIRPWIQAFSLGKPDYGAEQVQAQKQAIYDAGVDGWVLWHPGSKYQIFLPAIERGELVSRKKVDSVDKAVAGTEPPR